MKMRHTCDHGTRNAFVYDQHANKQRRAAFGLGVAVAKADATPLKTLSYTQVLCTFTMG